MPGPSVNQIYWRFLWCIVPSPSLLSYHVSFFISSSVWHFVCFPFREREENGLRTRYYIPKVTLDWRQGTSLLKDSKMMRCNEKYTQEMPANAHRPLKVVLAQNLEFVTTNHPEIIMVLNKWRVYSHPYFVIFSMKNEERNTAKAKEISV